MKASRIINNYMKIIRRTGTVHLRNYIYMLSTHCDVRTWFSTNFYFGHISKNSAELNILVMNVGDGLFYSYLLYLKAWQQNLNDWCLRMICRLIN